MSVGDVPWRYRKDNLGTSIGPILGTSWGHPHVVICLRNFNGSLPTTPNVRNSHIFAEKTLFFPRNSLEKFYKIVIKQDRF